jgi:hypothetical protein
MSFDQSVPPPEGVAAGAAAGADGAGSGAAQTPVSGSHCPSENRAIPSFWRKPFSNPIPMPMLKSERIV